MNGELEMARLLLQRKVDVNARSADNEALVKNGPVMVGRLTALHFAAMGGHLEMVKLLLDAGPRPMRRTFEASRRSTSRSRTTMPGLR